MTLNSIRLLAAVAILTAFAGKPAQAQTPANPLILNYGWGQIVADPQYPIVGETTTISVTVNNDGDQAATNVQVKISFNDWGVTFNGWQQIGAIQTIPSIPGHGSATVSVTKTFQNRAHTCVEALIVGASVDSNPNDDRGQINLEVINAGETFGYNVPVGNQGQEAGQFGVNAEGHVADAAGQVRIVPVEVVPAVLDLAPGEFRNVKVAADLTGLPVGTQVLIKVEAVNLNTMMSSLEDRNNVIFEIQVTTAMQLKSDVVAALRALRNDMPNRNLKNRVGAAIILVQNSQNPRFWNGNNRLKKRGGAAVFAQEAAAILTLETILKSNISLELKKRVDHAIRSICDADRMLAEGAIADANFPTAAVNKRIDGDQHRQEGEYAHAVKAYAAAWKLAMQP